MYNTQKFSWNAEVNKARAEKARKQAELKALHSDKALAIADRYSEVMPKGLEILATERFDGNVVYAKPENNYVFGNGTQMFGNEQTFGKTSANIDKITACEIEVMNFAVNNSVCERISAYIVKNIGKRRNANPYQRGGCYDIVMSHFQDPLFSEICIEMYMQIQGMARACDVTIACKLENKQVYLEFNPQSQENGNFNDCYKAVNRVFADYSIEKDRKARLCSYDALIVDENGDDKPIYVDDNGANLDKTDIVVGKDFSDADYISVSASQGLFKPILKRDDVKSWLEYLEKSSLTKKRQEVVKQVFMRLLKGHSQETIANLLGLSLDQVKKAVNSLRLAYEEWKSLGNSLDFRTWNESMLGNTTVCEKPIPQNTEKMRNPQYMPHKAYIKKLGNISVRKFEKPCKPCHYKLFEMATAENRQFDGKKWIDSKKYVEYSTFHAINVSEMPDNANYHAVCTELVKVTRQNDDVKHARMLELTELRQLINDCYPLEYRLSHPWAFNEWQDWNCFIDNEWNKIK